MVTNHITMMRVMAARTFSVAVTCSVFYAIISLALPNILRKILL